MLIYNVTVNVENNIEQEWLAWMRNTHIPEVMATGFFVQWKMYRLLTTAEDNTGVNYAIQYFCESMDKYNTYQDKFAPALQAKHHNRYAGKVYAFRSLLEEVR
jgi:hypothetical protein